MCIIIVTERETVRRFHYPQRFTIVTSDCSEHVRQATSTHNRTRLLSRNSLSTLSHCRVISFQQSSGGRIHHVTFRSSDAYIRINTCNNEKRILRDTVVCFVTVVFCFLRFQSLGNARQVVSTRTIANRLDVFSQDEYIDLI